MLEGALRCGVCPTTLAGQRLDATTGRTEHGDLDGLAFCLESGGDVEQVLGGAGHVVVSYVAIVQDQGSGVNPEEQVGDLFYLVNTSTAPLVSSTIVGHTPDDTGLTECISETVSVVDVGGPLTTPLIERSEGGRLDSEV